MKRALISISLLLVFTSTLRAQLHGFLVDAGSGEPIAGATVRIVGKQLSGGVAQTSHANGEFRLTYLGIVDGVSIHGLGFRDTTIAFEVFTKGQAPIVIRLNLDVKQHEAITVTAQHHLAAIEDVPVSVSTVDAREIKLRAPEGLDNILRYIPGVSVTESEVNIRGASGYARSIGSRVLLLLDGLPVLSADNGDMKFDALPLFDVDHIEVVKGAGSALYGSSALGGVINVITRTPPEGVHWALQTTGGLYDQPSYESWRVPNLGRRFFDADLGGSATFDKVSALISGGFKRNEGYRLGDDYYRWHGFAKLNSRLSENTDLTISTLLANEDHGGWLYWKDLSNPLEPSDSLTAINGRIHSFKADVAGALSTTIGEDILASLKGNLVHTKFTTDPTLPGGDAGSHSSADAINLEADASLPIAPQIFFTSGLTTSFQSVTSDLFQDHHGVLLGAFVQAEIKPLTGLTATLGGRYDLIGYDALSRDGQFSPKAGLSYEISPGISVRTSYGYGFRAATIAERFASSKLDGFTIKPDSLLQSERSNSIELGTSMSDEHWKFDGAVFYSTFDHLIEPQFVTDQGPAFVQFRNVTKALLFGHEEELDWYPFGNATTLFRLGYTYVFPKDQSTGEILKFRPRHLLQAHAETKFGPVSGGIDFRYISEYETFDSTLAIQVVKDGTAKVPIYVFDARIGYSLEEILGAPVDLTFQVLNLLNYYYVEIVGNMAPLRSFSLQLQTHF